MEKEKKPALGDDEINWEKTKILQSDPKFINYIKWVKENGTIFQDIEFPVAYGESGYTGIGAANDIPANKAIVMIPNRLIVTTHKIKRSELGSIIEENPDIFDNEETNDADFNILALFVMREYIKKEKSFYYPMFQVSEQSNSMLSWTQEQINAIDDPSFIEEVKEFLEGMEDTWNKFQSALERHPKIFETGSFDKNIFYWSYEFVMTRCYGWSLPSTVLLPLADFINHDAKTGVTHYLIHKNFEENPKQKHPGYIVKKKRIDMSILGSERMSMDELKKLEIYERFNKDKVEYIKKNSSKLVESQKIFLEDINYNKDGEKIHDLVNKINFEMLKNKASEREIFHLEFFDSTDEEDNDTETEDEVGPRKAFNEMKKFDMEKLQMNINEKLPQGETKEEKADFCKDIKTVSFNSELEDKSISSSSAKKGDASTKCDNGEESDIDDETDWDWFDPFDDNVYFILTTARPEKKGNQLYNCYGRRTNKFLFLWYGFTMKNNIYDSYSFRLWLNISAHKLLQTENYKSLIYTKYIRYDEFDNGVFHEGQLYPINQLSKEIRLKMTSLNADLLVFLRSYLLVLYDGPDSNQILLTIPSSLRYEEFILQHALKILIELKKGFLTTVYEDEVALKKEGIDAKTLFRHIYQRSHKQIVDEQIKLISLLTAILKRLKKRIEFREAYLERVEEFEKDENELIANRIKIKEYLKNLYLGVFLKNKN